ncbi:MAG: ABC transporter substrate-binding protein [Spirochaetota bacterium]
MQNALKKRGYKWKDFIITGGGGGDHTSVLQARVSLGTPPSAVITFMGPNVWDLGSKLKLANLDKVAFRNNWKKKLHPLVNRMVQYKGHYVAVPVNAHRTNWMWINKKVFQKAKAKIPRTWNEFFQVADKIKKAGFIPLAHGGEPWQDATLFESVLLGIGGASFHKKTLVDMNEKYINSPTMVKVFQTMRRLKNYMDKDSPGRSWDNTTNMLINGKAAMQIMGDWVKGEFLLQNKKPGKDFLCRPAPGNQGIFVIDVDAFVMFKVKKKGLQKGQIALAQTLMEPSVQKRFNLIKGSIPSHLGVSSKGFDSCGRQSMRSLRKDKVVPAFAFVQANTPTSHKAMVHLITSFFNSDMPTKDAAKNLALMARISK